MNTPATYDIEDIFKAYNNKIYRLALSISRNQKDAEDIMQNTFLKILKNLAYFKGKSQLSTWIYKIAYNEALMHLRKKRSQTRLANYIKDSKKKNLLGLFVNWAKMPDEALLESELKERISGSIALLPIKYRMALLLDNVEEMPLKMSAEIMGLKINSLKTRLRRARLLMKSDITDYFNDRRPAEEKKDKRCGIWTGFIYDYVDGALGSNKEGAFKKHIQDCASCNSFIDTYLKAIRATKALECRDLPPELRERIKTFLFKKK